MSERKDGNEAQQSGDSSRKRKHQTDQEKEKRKPQKTLKSFFTKWKIEIKKND